MKKKTKLDDILKVLVQEALDSALKDRAGMRYHQQMTKDRALFEEPDLGKFLAEDEDAIPDEDNEIPGSQDAAAASPQQQPPAGDNSAQSAGDRGQDSSKQTQPSPESDDMSDKDGGDSERGNSEESGTSFDTVKDAINTLRSGKSLKDEDTKRAALDYYDSLTEEEREAMVVFLRSMGDILRGEAGDKTPPSPDDPPTNLKISKDDGMGQSQSGNDSDIGMGEEGLDMTDDGEEMFSLDDIESQGQDASQQQQVPMAPTPDQGQQTQQAPMPPAQAPAPQPPMQQQPQVMPSANPSPLPPPPPEAQEDTTPPRRAPIRVNESQDLRELRNYIRERMKR